MKSIKEYQHAYNGVIEDLASNSDVLGVTVFGSIITGDIWKNSDIDMFVILKDEACCMKDVFGEKYGIDVHMNFLSKSEFIEFRDNFIGGGKLHRKLVSSKLVIGKDLDVVDRYNYYKFLNATDKDRWNLAYLGDLIRAKGLCDKAISNGKSYNAIYSALKLGESIAKIYLNINGYLISSDPLTMAINLDDEFKECIDKVVEQGGKPAIENLIDYTENFLSKNIEKVSKLLINIIKKEKEALSIEELKGKKEFKTVSIEFDKILRELAIREIIKRKTRTCYSSEGQKIIEELTYYYGK
ncbi:nucleotidyltransferase domain-containing protein [uncultured Clostridium sp.]|uniref:nucleotidyltransferase domain-containing protein n=1 Tax=uncultured Clostridium sp. TaxID=59620 RepID=UPI0026363FB3|nr:nucleotidyltransferase domain-containing protein [uncultured Clostridium sp.]